MCLIATCESLIRWLYLWYKIAQNDAVHCGIARVSALDSLAGKVECTLTGAGIFFENFLKEVTHLEANFLDRSLHLKNSE